MKTSTIKIYIFLFWIIVWHLIYLAVGQDVILASPAGVLNKLFLFMFTSNFYKIIFFTLSRILFGFLLAMILGMLTGGISATFYPVRYMVSPIISIIKAAPVASFIILMLVMVRTDYVPVIITFIMVLPIFYNGVINGAKNLDKDLNEMVLMFKVRPLKKLFHVYMPQILPFIKSAIISGVGLAWKAGITAEVISLPKYSIGKELYNSKVYLETENLFAWTVVIILLSIIIEKIIIKSLNKILNSKGAKA